MTARVQTMQVNRRHLLQTGGAGVMTFAFGAATTPVFAQGTPEADVLDDLVIDLAGVPESIDPALAYSSRDWSVVHSIYDSIVQFGPDGAIQPLAASAFTTEDSTTFEVALREGLTFHDGTPVTTAAISRSVAYMKESGSSASSLFAGIVEVQEDADGLTARIVCDQPSPWLPAQLAPWLLLLPESFSHEQALESPVGSGPYRFESQEQGNFITLVRNEDYTWGSSKGVPMANRVTFRFVPESATRIADLSTGAAQIVTEIPVDQLPEVESQGGNAVEEPIVASAFIRIATDVEPFDNPDVRLALNHALDVQSIATALVSPMSTRLGSLFPDERSMAFNPDVEPFEYDPERARELLSGAGIDELEIEIEVTSGARTDVAEAIAAQLGDVGISASITVSEYAEFNATWAEPTAPALRLVTWGPLYDPHTLLSLVFASDGFLSRYRNAEVDRLIQAAAVESDPEQRAAHYQELSAVMSGDAPAVFLWNLTSAYGVADQAMGWQPRGDDYVIPTIEKTTS